MPIAAILKFILVNWRFFIGGAIVAGVVWAYNSHVNNLTEKAYNDGLAAEKKVCDKKMTDLEDEHKAYVDKAEKGAKDAADELDKLRGESKTKIADLNRQLDKKQQELNKFIYGQDGKVISCPEIKETGIYLGTGFTTEWNRYNKELVK